MLRINCECWERMRLPQRICGQGHGVEPSMRPGSSLGWLSVHEARADIRLSVVSISPLPRSDRVFLELRAIPFAESRRGLVGGLAKFKQSLARRSGPSHIVIAQQELRKFCIVGRRRRANGRFWKS